MSHVISSVSTTSQCLLQCVWCHLNSVVTQRLLKDYHVLMMLILLTMFTPSAVGQNLRPFPPLFNVARQKTVFTEPAQSTCGTPVRNAYCRSSSFVDSIRNCRQDFCVHDCPGRTSLPQAIYLLAASGYGSCVTADTENVRPDSPLNSYAAVFSGSPCFLTTLSTPSLGNNGAFTLTLWMWQQRETSG